MIFVACFHLQSKCSQYWPASTSEEAALELPEVDLRVELLREIIFSHYILRKIRRVSQAQTYYYVKMIDRIIL